MNYSDLTCHTPPPLTWSNLSTELEDSHSDCIPLHLQVPHHTDMAMSSWSWTKSNTSTEDWVLKFKQSNLHRLLQSVLPLRSRTVWITWWRGTNNDIVHPYPDNTVITANLTKHLLVRLSFNASVLSSFSSISWFSYIFITFILRNIWGFSFFHINGIIMVRSWDLNSIINACGFIFQFHLQQSSQRLFSLYIRFKPILLTAILTFIWTTSPKIYSHFNSKFKHFSEIFFSATFLPRLPDGTNFSSQFLRT